ncbi:MAG: histidine--tRNA ligase [Lachnospiraceae bacterium]|nr:histidine--tRNA ligase [Lachnospiraceae bacterium]
MAFNKKPVTGMRDILPAEMEVRIKLQGIIRETYSGYGFTEIETPLVEHIGNLTSKQGGENEKLIFKILKRGDNLRRGLAKIREGADNEEEAFDALTEEGLRYDLTLPLSRYYAANSASLPQPFKALQMGPVFRADRPQKGRFRQFMQCDIDILGDATNLAEKELMLATSEALEKIGFSKYNFYIVINDRRFLFELIKYAGMDEAKAEEILITLDKADKIGADGVDKELMDMGCSEEETRRLREILDSFTTDAAGVRAFAAKIGSDEALSAGENVADIMESVAGVSGRNINVRFDPTLVRGMGYYTGTIFEIKTEAFGSSVGGGGRYDKMVGRFTGQNVPAVGFSIGFERIMTILMDSDMSELISSDSKCAWLIEKGMPADRLAQIFDEAGKERANGRQILTVWMAKNKKFQKDNLTAQGYKEFRDIYREELKH